MTRYGYASSGSKPVTPLKARKVDTAVDEVRGVLFDQLDDDARLYVDRGDGWIFIGTVHYDGRVSDP